MFLVNPKFFVLNHDYRWRYRVLVPANRCDVSPYRNSLIINGILYKFDDWSGFHIIDGADVTGPGFTTFEDAVLFICELMKDWK